VAVTPEGFSAARATTDAIRAMVADLDGFAGERA
jgi:hypothetical protein